MIKNWLEYAMEHWSKQLSIHAGGFIQMDQQWIEDFKKPNSTADVMDSRRKLKQENGKQIQKIKEKEKSTLLLFMPLTSILRNLDLDYEI